MSVEVVSRGLGARVSASHRRCSRTGKPSRARAPLHTAPSHCLPPQNCAHRHACIAARMPTADAYHARTRRSRPRRHRAHASDPSLRAAHMPRASHSSHALAPHDTRACLLAGRGRRRRRQGAPDQRRFARAQRYGERGGAPQGAHLLPALLKDLHLVGMASHFAFSTAYTAHSAVRHRTAHHRRSQSAQAKRPSGRLKLRHYSPV
jgi:hypothetical protein